MKKINLWIDDERLKMLDEMGKNNGVGMSENIRRAISVYLEAGAPYTPPPFAAADQTRGSGRWKGNGIRFTRKTYACWANMRRRCLNKKCAVWKDYGGRGINICPEWVNDFGRFLKDMGNAPEHKSLGRIDNNGDYTPKNCRWETYKEQANNTRKTRPKINIQKSPKGG